MSWWDRPVIRPDARSDDRANLPANLYKIARTWIRTMNLALIRRLL